ncbi:MAG TPA: STAS-like domain-containing protein [Rhodanobacteraceae bacterium]
MVNNAIDHSEGRHLALTVLSKDGTTMLWVSDDGIGIFRKIAKALALPDDRLALLELAKGKFTTNPREHTGEGVFFSSRVFDFFHIASGGLVFDHSAEHDKDLLTETPPGRDLAGTTVLMSIKNASRRTLKQVFDAFSSGPDEYSFAKTIVPVRLARIGNENLISRSQAKRLMLRVEGFRHVVLDFASVPIIGQSFADEVFRVFALRYPDVELVAIHAVPAVQQMIRRAQVAHDNFLADQ